MPRYARFLVLISCITIGATGLYNFSIPKLTERADAYTHDRKVIKGLSFVAPRNKFESDPMPSILQVYADWIAVIPYGFTRKNEAALHYNSERQWWGERTIGTIETIKLAQSSGINVMMKPQVWIHRSWTGDLSYDQVGEWEAWESDYRDYILHLAKISEEYQVPLFCIGTEFRNAVKERSQFWKSLIEEIKCIYSGKLTYAANWDDYQQFPFWEDLDYIGINAYFPLSEEKEPAVSSLKKAWKDINSAIRSFSQENRKPILFTEYGYLSLEGCAGKTWELERKRSEIPSNEKAQSNAIQAIWETFGQESYWHGGFLWKWYPSRDPQYFAKDYTPQNKLAQEKLKEIWQKK